MAIKAIINNTEKEIEQIKNSDGQDIDYVYSRIGDTKVEGEPPISIKSIGGNLTNYRIYGNTVDGESVGDRSGNLWNEIYDEDGNLHYVPIKVEDGEYTLSTTTPNVEVPGGPPAATIFLLAGNVNTGASTTGNGCWLNNPKTVQSIDGYVTIAYDATEFVGKQCHPWNNNTMLNSGSTALPYEPYVCKVPVTVEGKNLVTSYLVEPNGGMQFDPVVFAEVNLQPNTEYLITFTVHENGVKLYSNDLLFTSVYYSSEIQGKKTMRLKTKTSLRPDQHINNKGWVLLRNAKRNPSDFTITDVKLQLVSDTPIYLPEPLKMVGDEAEYVDYREQKMHKVRKNLFPVVAISKTVNGITFTVNADKSVTCNGTNNGTSSALFEFNPSGVSLEIGESYIVTGCPEGGKMSGGYTIQYNNGSSWSYETGHGATFTVSGSGVVRPRILISREVTVNNLTFYPMIRKANIEDDTYEPYIEDTELDVAIPALSTIKGTNTFSVNTSIQPSNIYVKDNFDYKKVFTAIRTIEDELPLNYRNIEDNDSTLDNYRIYGNTVGGESVGDRTENLFANLWKKGYIRADNGLEEQIDGFICSGFFPVEYGQTYSISRNINVGYDNIRGYRDDGSFIGAGTDICDVSNPFPSAATNIGALTVTNENVAFIRFNDSANDLGMKYMIVKGTYTKQTMPDYEPYGYKVPVTVSNGTDTLTTPIYLPEQIRKVGDEAEYIDYGEQKQHRVRKNLLQNTATSQTINGVTFTVNSDGSVTCNGTANNTILYEIQRFPRFSGKYILSGCPINGSKNTCRLQYTNMSNMAYQEYGPGVDIYQFDETQYPTSRINIRIEKGYTCNNLTFYPMIRKADIEDDTYEPYIPNTELDVTLPALPMLPGTNTLSVGTEAQPSDIYLKGKIKKKPKIYYKIYYYSQDGQTALSTETVEEGHDCTYSTVPTKESDTDFDYTFTGWSTSTNSTTATAGATENIQQNTNLYAAFSKSFKTDTISDSWEEIIANCDNGTYASKYQIGDLKTIDVGTEGPVQMQIVAIDTDLLASDNTQTAPITWISKQLLNTDKAMHSTSSNYLSDWANCDMRAYLRGTILPMLPSVVQNGIKEVTKYTCKRTSSTTYTTVSTTENIWLPSYREVSYYTTDCETSGVQYNSIFTNDYASQRIKLKVGEAEDDAYYWWTRSASGDSLSVHQFYFALVGRGGHTDYIGWDCTSFGGVAIGFCT